MESFGPSDVLSYTCVKTFSPSKKDSKNLKFEFQKNSKFKIIKLTPISFLINLNGMGVYTGWRKFHIKYLKNFKTETEIKLDILINN